MTDKDQATWRTEWMKILGGMLGLIGVAGWGSIEDKKLEDRCKSEAMQVFSGHLEAAEHSDHAPIWNKLGGKIENLQVEDSELDDKINDLRERVRWLESKHGR